MKILRLFLLDQTPLGHSYYSYLGIILNLCKVNGVLCWTNQYSKKSNTDHFGSGALIEVERWIDAEKIFRHLPVIKRTRNKPYEKYNLVYVDFYEEDLSEN